MGQSDHTENVRARLAAIVDSADDAIISKELDGTITSWNPAAEKIFGYTTDEIIGQNIAVLMPGDRKDEEPKIMSRIQRGESVEHFETVRQRKDGRLISISVTISPIRSTDGKIIGASKIARDITERKAAQEKINWLASFPGRNPNPIIEFDLTSATVVYTNPAAVNFFHDLDQLGIRHPLLRDFPDVVKPLVEGEVETVRREVVVNGRWYEQTINYIQDQRRVRAYNSDITERKAAEEQIQKLNADLKRGLEEFRSLIATAPVGIAVATDPECREIWGNAEFAHMLGTDVKHNLSKTAPGGNELPFRVFRDGKLVRPEELPMQLACREGREVLDDELTIERADGKVIRELCRATPLHDENGKVRGCIGVFLNITERKLAEEEVRKLNTELAQRVEERTAELQVANQELEAFSYSVSHDLRAPLRHIDGFVNLLRRDCEGALSEKGRHFMNEIAESARQMTRLIDDLLVFSRMGRAELRQAGVRLDFLFETVIQKLNGESQGRKIIWKIAPLPVVRADEALLRLVVVNLISNALKYTRPRDPACIEIGSETAGPGEVAVFIRDNGVGFDMAYVDKLFGVFQRLHADREFEGTGIGLATVRRIIARHGGRTWASGGVDRGATFYFSLPTTVGSVAA